MAGEPEHMAGTTGVDPVLAASRKIMGVILRAAGENPEVKAAIDQYQARTARATTAEEAQAFARGLYDAAATRLPQSYKDEIARLGVDIPIPVRDAFVKAWTDNAAGGVNIDPALVAQMRGMLSVLDPQGTGRLSAATQIDLAKQGVALSTLMAQATGDQAKVAAITGLRAALGSLCDTDAGRAMLQQALTDKDRAAEILTKAGVPKEMLQQAVGAIEQVSRVFGIIAKDGGVPGVGPADAARETAKLNEALGMFAAAGEAIKQAFPNGIESVSAEQLCHSGIPLKVQADPLLTGGAAPPR